MIEYTPKARELAKQLRQTALHNLGRPNAEGKSAATFSISATARRIRRVLGGLLGGLRVLNWIRTGGQANLAVKVSERESVHREPVRP